MAVAIKLRLLPRKLRSMRLLVAAKLRLELSTSMSSSSTEETCGRVALPRLREFVQVRSRSMWELPLPLPLPPLLPAAKLRPTLEEVPEEPGLDDTSSPATVSTCPRPGAGAAAAAAAAATAEAGWALEAVRERPKRACLKRRLAGALAEEGGVGAGAPGAAAAGISASFGESEAEDSDGGERCESEELEESVEERRPAAVVGTGRTGCCQWSSRGESSLEEAEGGLASALPLLLVPGLCACEWV